MRDLKKTAYLLLVGLLTAGILYPLLHEAGHWAATLLLGGEILEFHLLPRPNVLCELGKIGGAKRALIGLCGMALPFAAALVLHPKRLPHGMCCCFYGVFRPLRLCSPLFH